MSQLRRLGSVARRIKPNMDWDGANGVSLGESLSREQYQTGKRGVLGLRISHRCSDVIVAGVVLSYESLAIR